MALQLTLDQLIQQGLPNGYVREPGFTKLYVRYGRRYLKGRYLDNILDIANVEARVKGRGTFTRLILRLRATYPTMGIYVECVINPRFGNKLRKLGFRRISQSSRPEIPVSYYWLPK